MKVVDDVLYGKICGMNVAGLSPRQIAEELKISQRTVRYWTRKSSAPSTKQRRAPAKLVSHVQRRRAIVEKLVRTVKHRDGVDHTPIRRKLKTKKMTLYPFQHPSMIARELTRKYGMTTSRSTVRRDLLALNFCARKRRRIPVLTAEHKKKRVEFGAKAQLIPDVCARIRIGDEKIFNTNQSMSDFFWIKPGETVPGRDVAQYAPSVQTFIVFGKGYRNIVVIPRKNLNASDWRKEAFDKVAVSLRKDNGFLCIDNAPCHSKWREYARSKKIKPFPLEYPALSCDGNPTEQINSILERRVLARAPYGSEELSKFLLEEFWAIDEKVFDRLADSFMPRWKAIAKAKGEIIKP